jgi:hypothetical protein
LFTFNASAYNVKNKAFEKQVNNHVQAFASHDCGKDYPSPEIPTD